MDYIMNTQSHQIEARDSYFDKQARYDNAFLAFGVVATVAMTFLIIAIWSI